MNKGFIVLLYVVWLSFGVLSAIPDSLAASSREASLPPEPGVAEREDKGLTSIYGYGEMHFNAPKGGDNEIDFHRLVLGISHEFSDRIHFKSEVDFEHGFSEPYIEYAYLDFELNSAVNFRAGSVLVPMGFINEFHEPPVFFSVERSTVDARIIPTTWPEGAVGVYGSPTPGLNYRLYLVSGLNATAGFMKDTGFSAQNGLRGGRQKVAEATAEDVGAAGRVEYTGFPGLKLGASGYRAGADQGKIPGAKVVVTMWDADAQFRAGGLDVQGLYVQTKIDDAAAVNLFKGLTGTESIGEQMFGWYVVLGYHLVRWMPNDRDLVPFIRYEQLDTQNKVPSGFSRNPANELNIVTAGLAYYPEERVVLKADYQRLEDGADRRTKQFNLGMGYMF